MPKRVELAHAGHFICGHMCQMRRATYVNGYIVSTVGEYAPSIVFDKERRTDRRYLPNDSAGDLVGMHVRPRADDDKFEPLGVGPHLYETMVFPARRRKGKGAVCCPYVISDASGLEQVRHMTADEAVKFHEKTVRKYERKSK
jgi:hypothetical protein